MPCPLFYIPLPLCVQTYYINTIKGLFQKYGTLCIKALINYLATTVFKTSHTYTMYQTDWYGCSRIKIRKKKKQKPKLSKSNPILNTRVEIQISKQIRFGLKSPRKLQEVYQQFARSDNFFEIFSAKQGNRLYK